MTNRCTAHERCPNCAKIGKDTHGDNLGVYDDGHKYCFSCDYYEPIDISKWKGPFRRPDTIEEKTNEDLSLPSDVTNALNWQSLNWLETYNITTKDVIKHKLLWSEKTKLLIFPIFSENNTLLMWQGRSFNPDKNYKWFTKGKPEDIFHIIKPEAQPIREGLVLVEDIVSAIRVGHLFHCMPLFGSYISKRRMPFIRTLYDNIIIWLDHDKLPMAYKYARDASIYGLKSIVISTLLDPKAQNEYNIKDIIWRHTLFDKAKAAND